MNTRSFYHKNLPSNGSVVYLINRELRLENNFSLSEAYNIALKSKSCLYAAFCFTKKMRLYLEPKLYFLIESLKELEAKLERLNIPLFILPSDDDELFIFLKKVHPCSVVTDFNPLLEYKARLFNIAGNIDGSLIEVDSHNIVPARLASPKMEYGAYTIRPKIKRLLAKYLSLIPTQLEPYPYNKGIALPDNRWESLCSKDLLCNVMPGEANAFKALYNFIETKLKNYADMRNDPNMDATSRLSTYLHFGNISSLTVAKAVLELCPNDKNSASFLEELIIRKELSDNFCFYNPDYNNIKGAPRWAKETLNAHLLDKREYVYSKDELESAATHDMLWNAAQKAMVKTGFMHGYMRMYWAKKILEWTPSPEIALEHAIYLNDKYSLDGCDPNGYTGIMWSICGVHDRAWKKRSIFGKIRYMNYNGCKRKFDVKKYIEENA